MFSWFKYVLYYLFVLENAYFGDFAIENCSGSQALRRIFLQK